MAERVTPRMHQPAANAAEVVPDFNPYLEPYRHPRRDQGAGSGHIYAPTQRDLIQWQTRPALPTAYEQALADTLEQIFAQRIYELPDVVAALNREGLRTPDGAAWTEANFQDTLRQLGSLAFGSP